MKEQLLFLKGMWRSFGNFKNQGQVKKRLKDYFILM